MSGATAGLPNGVRRTDAEERFLGTFVAEETVIAIPTSAGWHHRYLLGGVLIVMLASRESIARDPAGFVSIVLDKVSAERSDELFCSLSFCVHIDNDTGSEIKFQSVDGSTLDGLEVLVTDCEGKVLVQQSLTAHLSPVSPEGKTSTIPRGKSTSTIDVPVFGISERVQRINVRLVGSLWKSTYRRLCSTETVPVPIEPLGANERRPVQKRVRTAH